LLYIPHILQLDRDMSIVPLLISLFISNGFTVDDLGLLLAMVAVVILITGVIYSAAVGPLVQGPPSSDPHLPACVRLDVNPSRIQGCALP
jgi:hypothetical protein